MGRRAAAEAGVVAFTGLGQRADEVFAELTRLGIDQFAGGARIISGWARAMEPGGADTVEEVREAFAVHSQGGRRIFSPLYLALLSDIEAVHRTIDEAGSTLNKAEQMASATGERVWDAQLSARRLKLRADSYKSGVLDGGVRLL